MAREEMVLDLNIFGINLDVVGTFLAVAMDCASLTMRGRICSV
jgi:hypothetical protein